MLPDLRIAAVITQAPLGQLRDNLDKAVKWIRRARREGARIVCFPEMSLSGYSTRDTVKKLAQPLDGPLVSRMRDLALETRMVILAGFVESDSRGRIFASHLVAAPGRDAAVYRKTHVAPPEQGLYAAGQTLPLFEVDGWRLGIQLCYDAHFPGLTTRMALDGADVIFFPHASPRGTPHGKLESWMRHLPARAFDNGLFVVACNQTGDNGEGMQFPGVAVAIGPSGKILAQKTTGKEELLRVDLKWADLKAVRQHRMRYFLPNRRPDLYLPADKE